MNPLKNNDFNIIKLNLIDNNDFNIIKMNLIKNTWSHFFHQTFPDVSTTPVQHRLCNDKALEVDKVLLIEGSNHTSVWINGRKHQKTLYTKFGQVLCVFFFVLFG